MKKSDDGFDGGGGLFGRVRSSIKCVRGECGFGKDVMEAV